MSKQLIIAENPRSRRTSPAPSAIHQEKISSSRTLRALVGQIGHLLELTVPAEFEVKRGKWSFAHLPVIPPTSRSIPIEKTEDRLKLLTRLIKRKDVTGLINACDAGREGN